MENQGEDMANDESGPGIGAGMNRRNLIKTGAAVGAAAWVLPQVVSMSSALASGIQPGCSFSVFENFHGLDAGGAVPPGPGFKTYGPNPPFTPLSFNGWTTAPGTKSIDAVVFGSYNSNGFDDTAPSKPVIIDLAGSPGPGGITKTFTVRCEGNYRVKFQRKITDKGTFTLNVTGITTPVSGSYSGASVTYESLPFTANIGDAVVVTFFSPNTGVGNEYIGNILVEYI
jgi:hypothetical protein